MNRKIMGTRYFLYQRRYKLVERYRLLLLTREIRLIEIPNWALEHPGCSKVIHITAFRADRGTSLNWFLEDLLFTELEIKQAEKEGNARLAEALKPILRDYRVEYNILVKRQN